MVYGMDALQDTLTASRYLTVQPSPNRIISPPEPILLFVLSKSVLLLEG